MDTSIEETSFPPIQGTEMNKEAAFPPKLCNFLNKLNGITALNNSLYSPLWDSQMSQILNVLVV